MPVNKKLLAEETRALRHAPVILDLNQRKIQPLPTVFAIFNLLERIVALPDGRASDTEKF